MHKVGVEREGVFCQGLPVGWAQAAQHTRRTVALGDKDRRALKLARRGGGPTVADRRHEITLVRRRLQSW